MSKSQGERREKKLSLLLEIFKELSKTHELDRLLDKVVAFTFQVMNADRVSILLLDEPSGDLVPRVSRSRTGGRPRGTCRSRSRGRRWRSGSRS